MHGRYAAGMSMENKLSLFMDLLNAHLVENLPCPLCLRLGESAGVRKIGTLYLPLVKGG